MEVFDKLSKYDYGEVHFKFDKASGLKPIACKKGITLLSVGSSRMLLAYGFLRHIFEIFEKHQTPVDLVATSEVSVSMTIDNAAAVDRIARELSEIGTVSVENGVVTKILE